MYSNWFKESETFSKNFNDKHSIGFQIQKDPDTSIPMGKQICLIGYDAEIADAVRRNLYQCSYNFSNLQLLDLGNLRKKDKSFVVQILDEIVKSNLNIIVLGADQHFLEAQLSTIKTVQNIAFVEKSGKTLFTEANKKLLFNSDFINNIKLIGYQTHLLHADKMIHPKLKQSMSLGEIRNNMRDAEPVLRDISSINFMLESIRYSEIPGIKDTSPSGFTSEEACQLMKYFGLNSLVNSLSFYGYHPKYDFHDQGVKMLSQLIWYFLEGLDNQKMDRIESKDSMTQYVVEMTDHQLSLIFWKSEISGRWWVEMPGTDKKEDMLPCSYKDYKIACNDEMPKRIMRELS